ncbi:MAG: transcriptional regulator, partial [Actinobacteria bacterium]
MAATVGGVVDDTDLRIHLLGVFHVGVASRHVDDTAWRLKRPAALVKLLALAEGHRLHREQVMDRLWPDLDPKAAAANLRKAVHLARRALDQDEGARWLRSEGDLLALPRDAWVDVDAFDSAASDARRSGDLKVYRAALELYTGDLLPEDRYEEWVGPRQDELRT